MNPRAPVEITDLALPGPASAVYAVVTQRAGTVYLRVSCTDHGDALRAVVIADVPRLVRAWQRGTGPAWRGYGHRALECTRRSLGWGGLAADQQRWGAYLGTAAWMSAEGYGQAGVAFAAGQGDPVPLATVRPQGPCGLQFTAGADNAMWMMAQGATAFPIECGADSALRLAAMVGVTNSYAVGVEAIAHRKLYLNLQSVP